MPKIFISYRRKDSASYAGRLYDSLIRVYGQKNVFKDVIDIGPGTKFAGVIGEAINKCDVALVLIGPQWLNIKDQAGNRRLDDPNDYVRFEIESALRRDKCQVIPVLVGGATMPDSKDLPEKLRPLADLNGVTLREDPDYIPDVNRLINYIGGKPIDRRVALILVGIVVLALLIGLVVVPKAQREAGILTPTSTSTTAAVSTVPAIVASSTPLQSTSTASIINSTSVQPTNTALVLSSNSAVQASITRSENAFVLALTTTTTTVALDNVKFEIVGKPAVDFSRFVGSLGLNPASVETPFCLRLLRQGQSAAYPDECQSLQPNQRYSVEVSDSDVFWYDAENGRNYTMNVTVGAADPVACTPQQATCPVAIAVP